MIWVCSGDEDDVVVDIYEYKSESRKGCRMCSSGVIGCNEVDETQVTRNKDI